MNSYHFSLGNSTEGPVGYCARVQAESPEEALELLKAAIAEIADGIEAGIKDLPGIEYAEVYFNPAPITTADIDEWDTVDEEDELD